MNESDAGHAGLTIERSFAAPAKAVFEAWTNPEVMRRWWHPEPDWDTPHAESDLRVGGALRVVMRDADGADHGGGGEYTVVDPHERLSFTWTWDDEEGWTSLVELIFTEDAGRTRVVMNHSGLRSAEDAAGHEEGWRNALDNLERKALGQ